MFDIRDVLRTLRVEPEKSITWPVGFAIRDRFQEANERLPDKQLRRKTNGKGGHCLAVYPDTFWDEAVSVARSVLEAIDSHAARQPDLFQPPENSHADPHSENPRRVAPMAQGLL